MGTITTLVSTDECSPKGTPVSARVMKRVAEASLGLTKDVPYWFVVPREPGATTFNVLEYKTCEEAKAVRDALPNPEIYMVLGPVVRPMRSLKTSRAGLGIAGTNTVVETPIKTITLEFDDPSIDPVVLNAKVWDALFWGDSSVDKFAIPYYVAASGIEYGLKVYNAFHGTNVGCPTESSEENPASAYVFVHEPDTDYTVFYLGGAGLIAEPQELPL